MEINTNMAFTKQARPTQTFAKVALSRRAVTARFGIARFATAKFGASDSYTKQVKPSISGNYTKQSRT